MYYAGWSGYYLAFMTGNQALAEEALGHFGWLLNAEAGQPPEIERLPPETLRYEHVARAAGPSTATSHLPSETCWEARPLNARASAFRLTRGHTAAAASASRLL